MSILAPLYNKPNHVLEKQQLYQNTNVNVMYRGPRQRLYVGAYRTLFGVGMIATAFACFSMIKGDKAE